jgi:hypothetical protein
MLVVLASRHDAQAREFAAGLAADAALLTCDDLSVKGWCYVPGGRGGRLVAGGRRIAAAEVDGVLTRLPSVTANELAAIVPDDRDYVAAEMNAFLAAWLSELDCPVLNRPGPVCLMGPYLRQEKWVHLAASLGIPVVPATRSVAGLTGDGPHGAVTGAIRRSIVVNVVGRLCVGEADPAVCAAAAAIAEAAGVSLLRAVFAGPAAGPAADTAFVGADYWVDVSDPEVSAAIAKYFAEGPAR